MMPLRSFRTERLLIRPWTENDVEAAFSMYGDPEVTRYLGHGQTEPDLDSQKEHLLGAIARYESISASGYGFWAVERQEDREVVGAVLLKELPLSEHVAPRPLDVELGWHLAKKNWGKGYATEAAATVLKYGHEDVGLEKIFAIVYPENEKSIRVTQRLGMEPLGLTSDYYGVSHIALFVSERGRNGPNL